MGMLETVSVHCYDKTTIWKVSNFCTDDRHITVFLRGCKYSIEKTKEKLDFFNSIRSACPDFFDNMDEINKAIEMVKQGYGNI